MPLGSSCLNLLAGDGLWPGLKKDRVQSARKTGQASRGDELAISGPFTVLLEDLLIGRNSENR